jgi:hypothetical protein
MVNVGRAARRISSMASDIDRAAGTLHVTRPGVGEGPEDALRDPAGAY